MPPLGCSGPVHIKWSQQSSTSCQDKPRKVVWKSQWRRRWSEKLWILMYLFLQTLWHFTNSAGQKLTHERFYQFWLILELTDNRWMDTVCAVVKSWVPGAEVGWILPDWVAHTQVQTCTHGRHSSSPTNNNFYSSRSWTRGSFGFSFGCTTHQKEDYWKKNPTKGFPVKDVNKPEVGQLEGNSRGETIDWYVRWRGSRHLGFSTHVL